MAPLLQVKGPFQMTDGTACTNLPLGAGEEYLHHVDAVNAYDVSMIAPCHMKQQLESS